MGETGNGWDMKGEWQQWWPIIGDDDDDDDEERASGRGEGNLEQEIPKNRA